MPSIQYPFIDIAVHPRVRERFARGEAMALFSTDMARVLWANGAGAALFGHAAIYDFLDQGPQAGDVSFRQIESTARQLAAAGDSRSFLIRMTSGFQRGVVNATVEVISTQLGEPAILFSAPVAAKPLSAADGARRMLSGFDDPDTHMAVIDHDGQVIAASPHFAALGITQQTAKMLATMAGAQTDRLIKRPIPTGQGYLPAAIGKLSEIPALHLVFVVETVLGHLDPVDQFASPHVPDAPAAAPAMVAPPSADVIEAVAEIEDVDDAPVEMEVTQDAEVETDDLATLAAFDWTAPEPVPTDAAEPIAEPPAADIEATSQEEPANEAEAAAVQEPAATTPEAPIPYEAQPAPAPADAKQFAFDHNGRAVRFVWKIDAEGRFNEISHEFAEAVGPHAARITGEAFADVAARFHLDPEGKIGSLLARRDTWSGRTIHWPVEGTNLVVPVDLAALPTYTRNREFDGFRGFGVVRLSDAFEDASGIGLTLGPADEAATGEEGRDEPDATEAVPPAIAEEAIAEDVAAGEPAEPSTSQAPADEVVPEPQPAPEPPALTITETPNRRLSDKIIQLHEHRSLAREGLSPSEHAAFREIARQLEPFGKRGEPPAETSEASPAESKEVAEPPRAEDSAKQPSDGAAPVIPQTSGEAFDVLNTAIPPRVKATSGLNAEMLDLLPVAALVHAGDRLIHANPEFLRLTGYASLADLDDVGGLDALLQQGDLDDPSERAGAMMVVRGDDAVIPVSARLQSIRWDNGTALMLALIPAEQGAERQPETARGEVRPERMLEKVGKLQVEVEELQSILETATDGVVVIGPDGDIRTMNRSASALFNYDDDETRGRPFVMLFAHESQKAVLDYLGGLSGHGVASVLNDGREVIGREASGGFVPLFMTMGRLTSSNGYCAVIRDITQWKRTEEELRNAKRAAETANAHKSDFLARVSHEIRTPLNAIIGFSDMMAGERFGPIGHSRYVEYANDIGRSGRHVLDIVNDLLDISKIEAGEMELDFTSVGLNEAIAEAVSLVQPQANSQRVIIRTALSQSVPNVVADLRSIKQIALNILSNAIRFTPSGGQIVVSTSYESNGSVVMRIRDTGTGMSRTELEHAMKPFRQVSASARNRGDGTGLGLPLTKAMADANRATFSIQSAPNEGTLVEITFPSQRVLAN
ncbi:ATP-binding protein [Rhizobium sp. RAF56]|uniref:ATP-binding protein n=1 Tax=Rhizobium sp. RAF56 TaxID=3233062 RepID=UPI003F94E8E1